MKWCANHGPLVVFLIVVLSFIATAALGQELTEPVAVQSADPVATYGSLLAVGGPGFAVAWLLRGLLASGVPIKVQLADEDRRRIDRALHIAGRNADVTDPGER